MLNFKNTTYVSLALFLMTVFIWKNDQLYSPWIIVLILYVGIVSWGAFDLRLNFFMQSTTSVRKNVQQVAITFDDGPTPFTLEILDLLDQYQAKASFFCIGTQVVKYPMIAKQIIERGHVIANHSMNHPNKMGFLPSGQVVAEINEANHAIETATGKKVLLYRPPFGVSNPHIAKALHDCKLKSIGWNIRSLDTLSLTEDQIFARIAKKLSPGSIILLHDTSEKTVHIVKSLLIALKVNKLEAVNLEDFLNQKVYEN